jgi:hypothetical protein
MISMMMRMTEEATRDGQIVAVPGTEKVANILSRFRTENGWNDPIMTAHWGKFFDPSTSEVKTSVDATEKALSAKLISHSTAVEYSSHDFKVDSVSKELVEIERDEIKSTERETSELQRMGIVIDDGGKQSKGDSKKLQKSSDSGRPENGKNHASGVDQRSPGAQD